MSTDEQNELPVVNQPMVVKEIATGKKWMAAALPRSKEWVTWPFGNFWNQMIEDVSGIWPQVEFWKRFRLP